jgi:hypothetical protein
MRYLLNLPLVIALAALAMVFDTAVLSRSPGGGDAALGAAYAELFGTFLVWFMLGLVLAACGAMGGLRWPAARGFAGCMIALMGFGFIVVLALQPLGIAMELHAVRQFGTTQTAAARLAAFGLPFVLMLYAAWMINAPAANREQPAAHGIALGAIGLLCLVAAVVSAREMGRQAEQAQADAAAIRRQEDEQSQQVRRVFATLTDADPLLSWDAYVGYSVPDDVRIEALRRVAVRPTLEADLTRALADSNWNWSDEALSLIVRLPFQPSAGLVQPVHAALADMAAQLMQASREVTYEHDKWLDDYQTFRLATALQVAEKMADAAGADLRNDIDAIARAVALFPKSETARSFPAKAAETKAHIAKILAARRH